MSCCWSGSLTMTLIKILVDRASCCSLKIVSVETLLMSSYHLMMVNRDFMCCALMVTSSRFVSRFALMLIWVVTPFINFLQYWHFYYCSTARKYRYPCSYCYYQSTLWRPSSIFYHHYNCFHLRSFCYCMKRINSKIVLIL